jgi:hypothetical protein
VSIRFHELIKKTSPSLEEKGLFSPRWRVGLEMIVILIGIIEMGVFLIRSLIRKIQDPGVPKNYLHFFATDLTNNPSHELCHEINLDQRTT